MSGLLLVVDGPLDPGQRPLVDQAAARAGLTVQMWVPGEMRSPPPRPAALLASLGRGVRRMPPALSQLADSLFPDVPVVLLGGEPLIQPVVLLAGGRICLLGAPLDGGLLGERLLAALRWRPAAPTGPAFAIRRSDIRVGRARGSLLVAEGSEAAADRLETAQSHGLTALITPATDRPVAILQEVMPAIDAWQDQADSEQLRRSVATRGPGLWKALVHLDADAGRWLLAAPAGDALVVVASAMRFPNWWRLTDPGDGAVRLLPAETGDVVVAITGLPDTPEFTPATLAGFAALGASALTDHLAGAIRPLGRPLTALIVEVGP